MKEKYILLVMMMATSLLSIGQPPPPPATPIDGGLGALIAGGLIYGISRIKKFKGQ